MSPHFQACTQAEGFRNLMQQSAGMAFGAGHAHLPRALTSCTLMTKSLWNKYANLLFQ